MVANWLYYQSTGSHDSHPHFRAIGFYLRSFRRVDETGAWLREWAEK